MHLLISIVKMVNCFKYLKPAHGLKLDQYLMICRIGYSDDSGDMFLSAAEKTNICYVAVFVAV